MPMFNPATGSPAPFIGHVGARSVVPTALIAGPNYLRSIDTDFSSTDFDTLIGGWAFWRLNNGNEVSSAGTTTFIGYCEYPAGSGNFFLAEENKANSNNPISFNLAGADKTCYLTFKVPGGKAGVPFRWWMMQDAPAGGSVFWRQGQILDQIWPSGQGMDGPGNGVRPAVLATYGSNFSEYSFPPVVTLALTTVPSALLFHDSREECNSEAGRPPFYVNGPVASSIVAAGRGVSKVGASGMSLSQFLSGNAYAQRVLLARWFTDIGRLFGVNDMVGQSRTPAQFQADCLTFKALFPGKRVFGNTVMANPGTSDGYATLSGQTSGAPQTRINGANERIRAQSTGEAYVLDSADKADPYWLGKVPVDRNPNVAARATSCQFTASIAANFVMTVTAIASGAISINDPLTDSLTTSAEQRFAGCTVLEQLTGTAGSTGTYRVSRNFVLTSRTLYVGGYAMTDGFHQTKDLSEQIMAKLAPDVAVKMTPRPLVV